MIIASGVTGLILGGATIYGAYLYGRVSFRKDMFNHVFDGECEQARQILGMIAQAKTALYIHAGNEDVETVANAGKLMQKMLEDESCKDAMEKTARSILLLCDE